MSVDLDMIATLELWGTLAKEDSATAVNGEWMAAAGMLAGGMAKDLVDPLGRTRNLIGQVVEALDHHVGSARGPKPLPWGSVIAIRKQLAEAFLDLGQVFRLASDLASVTVTAPRSHATTTDAIDINLIVERAATIVGRRLLEGCDISADLGTLPLICSNADRLMQAVIQLLFGGAYASGRTKIVVRTRENPADLVIQVEYGPIDGLSFPFSNLVNHLVETLGGSFISAKSQDGLASTEIRLPKGP